MKTWVEIEFDCVPLRSVHRLDAPEDASPRFRELLGRIREATEKHGRHNTYYLHHATCTLHLTNDPAVGTLRFAVEGTLLTDTSDTKTLSSDLTVELAGETCDWLTEPIVHWFRDSVKRAVMVEFDRYIEAGDLARTRERLDELEKSTEASGGFQGMGL